MARQRQKFSVDQGYQIGELRQQIADADTMIDRYLGREQQARAQVENWQEQKRRAQHDLNELLEAAQERD